MSFTRSKGVVFRYIRILARRFRAFQEIWLLPWWGGGKAAVVPLWALDTLVLIVKLCSTCAMAIIRVVIPPAMKSLYGETVLITDTSRGLGRELAFQFAELGATVVCWDNDARRNAALINDIRSKDGEVIQAFLPSMIERRRGHIVAINSSAGLMPCADMAPYCAAMFGLRGLMDSISEELRLDTWTKNINTTSVYLARTSADLHSPPSHRFAGCYPDITPKEAASIIIEGIRKNQKDISIPTIMKPLITLNNVLPYRLRIIFTDFFNNDHRGWFSYC